MESADRESIVKEMIDKHPGISTTNLQKCVQGHMSKDTASKAIKNLAENDRIIRRKEGKKVLHYPHDAADDEVGKDLAAVLDDYVKDLCAMREGIETYPYDLLNAFHNEIHRQRDNLVRRKKEIEDRLKLEYNVDDVMHYYDEMQHDIVKSVRKYGEFADHIKIHECLRTMSDHLRKKTKRKFELIKERQSWGKGKKRDSLTKEIDQLGSDIDDILIHASDLQTRADLNPSRQGWRGLYAPPLVRKLEYMEEKRAEFQNMVGEVLNPKIAQDDEIKHWKLVEDGLIHTRKRLLDMKDELAKTKDNVIASYIGTERQKRLKEVSLLVAKILEMYPPDVH